MVKLSTDLNNISLALVGIKFLSRMSTPILWLGIAFLQIVLMSSLKLNLESIVTPKSYIAFIFYYCLH